MYTTITFGKNVGEVNWLAKHFTTKEAQLEYSKAFLNERRLQVMRDMLKDIWSEKNQVVRAAKKKEFLEMARASVNVNKNTGTITYMDTTLQILETP